MKIQKLAALSLLVLSSFAATGVAPTKSELEGMYDKAFREFDANHYSGALKALDAIDARQPDLAESLNLRGVILMRQGEYDKAEAALRKALQVEPKFWNASFNLAEIPFLRKKWAEARNRFEALVSGNSDEIQGETNLLLQYKVLLTFVLEDKEKMVDWILNKFEDSKDSPALYYSNAAIALQHKNEKEAKDWISAADKKFSPQLNKLFAESFYEIGWMQKPAGESRAALEITSTTERAERMKADAQANFEKAERAFQQRDFEGALKLLDLADEGAPNQAASYNLRGEILMEQKKFDEAEVALAKAFSINPKFREAQYNLAQIPFKKKEYAKARERLEGLFAATPGDDKNQAAQLIKFKIFLTLLLEEKDAPAQKMMDEFKFTGDTPALYYAQAAWAFKHADAEQGNDWITSARKIYSPALNIVFADSLYDVGWLTRTNEQAPATAALAQADASPAAPTPAMRLGQADSLPAPMETETGAAIVAASPAPVPPTAAPQLQSKPEAVGTVKPVVSLAAKPAAPRVAAGNPAVTPAATALAPAQARAWSQPSFGERADRAANPRTLLWGGLLLAGILLLIWLVVQQVRRHLPAVDLYNSSVPLTEPPFAGDSTRAGEETKIPRDLLAGGPPKVSLQLRASEALLREAVLPSAAIVGRGAALESEKRESISPNEGAELASAATDVDETRTPAMAEATPLRDEEEVSRAVAPPEFSAPAVAPEVAKEAEVETPAVVAGQATAADVKPPTILHFDELVLAPKEPVGQRQPIPQFTTLRPSETDMPELTQPEPKPTPIRHAPEPAAAEAAIAGKEAAHSSVETPSFASKIITTKPIAAQSTTPAIMPETTITPAPATRAPSSSTVAIQQPTGGMHTAVQLTFSMEIASMQLTPTFKMSGLQLKPMSKVVTMRLAPSQLPQPPMNLQVTFEVAKIDLTGGAISTIRLAPSPKEKPAVISSSSFPITGLELVPGGTSALQLTPTHQEQTSVHLTAAFQIAAIEFSPLFEIVAIVLNATSKNVSMQLPGSGPSSIDGAPMFEMESVQLGGNNDLGMVQVTPLGPSGRRLTSA